MFGSFEKWLNRLGTQFCHGGKLAEKTLPTVMHETRTKQTNHEIMQKLHNEDNTNVRHITWKPF